MGYNSVDDIAGLSSFEIPR